MTTGGAAGTISPGTPTCEDICNRIAQAGCGSADCANECNGSLLAAPGCGPEFDAALQCFSRVPIGCTPPRDVKFFGCEPYQQAASQCSDRIRPQPDPAPPPKPIPAQCVGGAPVPPGGMVCSGGASGSGSSGSGGNAPQTCQSECNDGRGNVWSSYCVGANCTCIYNGNAYCSCVSSAPCSSCCPGI